MTASARQPDYALYDLLPAIHRVRDAALGYPLRSLLAAISDQANELSELIAQRYDDWFIETCEDWAVPYIGDLVGARLAEPLEGVLVLGDLGAQEDGHARDPGKDFPNEFHPLPGQILLQGRQAGDVPGRSGKARHEAFPHGIDGDRHDDGDRGGGALGRQDSGSGCDYGVYPEPDQVGGEVGETLVSALRPSILDADAAPLDVA